MDNRAGAAESRTTEPRPRAGIVWIASFPKSGNTWTRTFLHNLAKLQAGESDEQRINEMNRFSTWEVNRRSYVPVLGFEPTTDHRREVAAARHKVQEQIADSSDGIAFVKTHNALVIDRGYPTINFAVTSGAIYIVRNPLDVAISLAGHMNRTVDQTITQMARENVETDFSEKNVHEVHGSWSQHVASWTRTPHRSIYIMRYEDMLADPIRTFGGLAKHLLLDPTDDQLSQAIDRSSFEKLRAQEEKEGFREKPKAAERFFREGRAGQWREGLTAEQVQRVVEAHGDQMRRFGYLDDDGKPV